MYRGPRRFAGMDTLVAYTALFRSGNIMLWLALCPRMFNQMRDPSMRSSTFRRSTLPCLLIGMSALAACAGTSGMEAANADEASAQMAMATLQAPDDRKSTRLNSSH